MCKHTDTPLFPLFAFYLNAVLHSHQPSMLKNLRSLQSVSPLSRGLSFLCWWNRTIGSGQRVNVDCLFKRITGAESTSVNGDQACLDEGFGDSEKAQGLPLPHTLSLSFPFCHSFLNRELTSCVRQKKDASSTRCQNVIWALSRHFHIKDTCEGCCTVLTCKTHCHFISLLFSLFYCSLSLSFLRLHLPLFFFVLHFDLCISIYLSPLAADTLFFCLFNSLSLFLFFSPLPLPPSLSHLERNTQTNIKKKLRLTLWCLLKKPLKTNCFLQGETAQTAESCHCCGATRGPELWPQSNEAGLMCLELPSFPPPAPKVLF